MWGTVNSSSISYPTLSPRLMLLINHTGNQSPPAPFMSAQSHLKMHRTRKDDLDTCRLKGPWWLGLVWKMPTSGWHHLGPESLHQPFKRTSASSLVPGVQSVLYLEARAVILKLSLFRPPTRTLFLSI